MKELRQIDMSNFRECIKLDVAEEQKKFVAANIYSLAESKADGVSVPLAIYNDGTMVGFIMYDYDSATETGWISRLMVDVKYQGTGCGRYALTEAVRRLKAYDGCKTIRTSFVPENTHAKKLYLSVGFRMTGEQVDGEDVCILENPGNHEGVVEINSGKQVVRRMEKDVVKTIHMDYLLYLPAEYDHEKKWPLVLFLHGAGERGRNPDRVKTHGPPKLVSENKSFPFILVSPLCPAYSWWNDVSGNVKEVLDEVMALYSVDHDRIYVTGLSMGGFGTFDMAKNYPDVFAAAVPICGGVKTIYGLEKVKNIPFWVFHGERDTVVPAKASKTAVDGIRQAGGSADLTIYPDVLHDSWTETYNNPEVYEWLLSQKRNSNEL